MFEDGNFEINKKKEDVFFYIKITDPWVVS